MGRKLIDRQLRKINVCMTISPDVYDNLTKMAKHYDMNHSEFVTMLIGMYHHTEWEKISNGKVKRVI